MAFKAPKNFQVGSISSIVLPSPVFEVIGKKTGGRWSLHLTEADARAFIGTVNMPNFEIRPAELPVVFLLKNVADRHEEFVETDFAYATIEAARAAQQRHHQIEIVEVK